jgi:hypothetical protein
LLQGVKSRAVRADGSCAEIRCPARKAETLAAKMQFGRLSWIDHSFGFIFVSRSAIVVTAKIGAMKGIQGPFEKLNNLSLHPLN